MVRYNYHHYQHHRNKSNTLLIPDISPCEHETLGNERKTWTGMKRKMRETTGARKQGARPTTWQFNWSKNELRANDSVYSECLQMIQFLPMPTAQTL